MAIGDGIGGVAIGGIRSAGNDYTQDVTINATGGVSLSKAIATTNQVLASAGVSVSKDIAFAVTILASAGVSLAKAVAIALTLNATAAASSAKAIAVTLVLNAATTVSSTFGEITLGAVEWLRAAMRIVAGVLFLDIEAGDAGMSVTLPNGTVLTVGGDAGVAVEDGMAYLAMAQPIAEISQAEDGTAYFAVAQAQGELNIALPSGEVIVVEGDLSVYTEGGGASIEILPR